MATHEIEKLLYVKGYYQDKMTTYEMGKNYKPHIKSRADLEKYIKN